MEGTVAYIIRYVLARLVLDGVRAILRPPRRRR